MKFDLTILGCNSARPAHGRFPSAQALNIQEHLYLIDCGEGTQSRLNDLHIKMSKIKCVFISHLHGDHIHGLMSLLGTLTLSGRDRPLTIFGPTGIREYIAVNARLTGSVFCFDLLVNETDTTIHKKIYEDAVVEVHTIPLVHRIACNGYLFREKDRGRKINGEVLKEYNIPFDAIEAIRTGANWKSPDGLTVPNTALTLPGYQSRSYAYCSDTAYQEGIVPYIEYVDLLYHEATYLHDKLDRAIETKHSTALQAAMIAKAANASQLVIGHYSSRYQDLLPLQEEARSIFPSTDLGIEGKVYSVAESRQFIPKHQ